MTQYLRVTDEVKPRREYTIHASQKSDAHVVLDKPATYVDGSLIPAKYTPADMARAAEPEPEPASTSTRGRKANTEKE